MVKATSDTSQIDWVVNVSSVPLGPTMTGAIQNHNHVSAAQQGTQLSRKEAPANHSVQLVRSLQRNCTARYFIDY